MAKQKVWFAAHFEMPNYVNPYLAGITFYISESVPQAETMSPKHFSAEIKKNILKHELTKPLLAICNSHTYSNMQLCNYLQKREKLLIFRQLIDVRILPYLPYSLI